MRVGICHTSPPTFVTLPSVYLSRESFVGSLPAPVLVKLPSSVAPLSIFESAASNFAWRSAESAFLVAFCSAQMVDEQKTKPAHTAITKYTVRRTDGHDMRESPAGRNVEGEPLSDFSVLLSLRERNCVSRLAVTRPNGARRP